MPAPSLPDQERLIDLIDAFADQSILMAADLVADRFITGTPKRVSREAPVLILRHDSEVVRPGGGANAVFTVRALDGRPLPVGLVGDDSVGDELVAILEAAGIATEGIVRRQGHRTPCKTRILGGSRHALKQQIVRFDIEDRLELTAAERRSLADHLLRLSADCSAVVFSDYGIGSIDPELAAVLEKRELLRLADSRYRLEQFTGIDGATPNLEELEAIEGTTLDDDLSAAGRRLLQRLEARFLLLTRGNEGMSLIDVDGAWRIPAHGSSQVADVTGAGDTVIGTFAIASAAGATPLEAALLANYAGGIVVMKMGTASLTRDELRQAVRRDGELLECVTWEA